MNFAIPFSKQFNYPQDNIQWNINYKPKIKQLNDFIEAYGTHRINLIISDFEFNRDYQIISILKEKFSESKIVVCLPTYTEELENLLSDNNVPHYYNEQITDWDKFQGFLQLNVTDIFVAENLAFNAAALSINAKEHNKSLRCYCNICESSWRDTPSLKTFFIRPEDIVLYKGLIDTFEFYSDNLSPTRVNTLYEVYAKKQQWLGQLDEIIIGYKGNLDNKFVIPRFGEKRLNCGKRCMKNIEPTCHFCDRIEELSELLKKENFAIVKKRSILNEE